MSDDETRWEETAAAVAHELSTPLTVAQAALHALVPTVGHDEQAAMLVDAARRSLRSIELQVSRLRRLEGTHAREPTTEQIDLVAMARELIADLDGSLLHEHPTRVAASEPATVTVDPDQIRQVLYNLLTNAAKYSPAGREIVISLEKSAEQIVLLVRDQGKGVAPEDAERIFEKYERADPGSSGAGLGLYLSRVIVEAHGGRLGLRDAEGPGAMFELVVPRRPPAIPG